MNTTVNTTPLPKEDETVDDLIGGRLKIFQKERGYRFSVDALLLAHFIRIRRRARVVDLGTGSGIISIMLAYRFPSVHCVGIEFQEALADMATRSVVLNHLEERIDIIHGDVKHIRDICTPQTFDTVVFNPPYRKLNAGRINPEREKAAARHELNGSLADFMKAAHYLAKDSGTVFVIYPATRGTELLVRMRSNAIEPKRLTMVHSNRSSRAEFMLAEGVKRGGEELAITAPLFIYEENGIYSRDMEELFRNLSIPVESVC